MNGRVGLVAVVAVVLAACGGNGKSREVVQQTHVPPDFVEGNPDCEDILGPGYTEAKFEFGNTTSDGTYTSGDFSVFLDFQSNGTFDFSAASEGVDAVIVKGGPNANVYEYDPEVTADTGLVTPTNPSNGRPYGYSHISFCIDDDLPPPPPGALTISKTAETINRRGWTWEIDKNGECPLVSPLPKGDSFEVAFWVTVTPTLTDDWYTSGTITIENETETDATITDVTDFLDDTIEADVDCGVTFPYVLPAGETLECDYDRATAEQPSTNTATVETDGEVEGATVTIDVTEGTATGTDDCITVEDNLVGELGTVCVDGETVFPYTFEYRYEIVGETCGPSEIVNTATFTTDDTGATGSDSFTTTVNVKCEQECPYEDKCEEPEYPTLTNALLIGRCGG